MMAMMWMEPGLYVRIEQLEGARAPHPKPLENGFDAATAYRVVGMHTPSETADAYVVLSNGRDEMWFICTRHLRVVAVDTALGKLRVPLAHFSAVAPARHPAEWPPVPRQMAARDD